MKTRKINKKLTLKKSTIARLGDMAVVRGGATDPDTHGTYGTCITICNGSGCSGSPTICFEACTEMPVYCFA